MRVVYTKRYWPKFATNSILWHRRRISDLRIFTRCDERKNRTTLDVVGWS